MDRRTLLTRIVVAFSAVAAAGVSIPFIRSLVPAFDNEISLDVDLGDLEEGDTKVVRWLGRHVYIVRRSAPVASPPRFDLQDPASDRSVQPDFARNASRSLRPEHLLVYANCTHLGCEVEIMSDGGDFSGFRCPCHSSEFDVAGRVARGSAAKLNLEVPDYEYVGQQVIRLRQKTTG